MQAVKCTFSVTNDQEKCRSRRLTGQDRHSFSWNQCAPCIKIYVLRPDQIGNADKPAVRKVPMPRAVR